MPTTLSALRRRWSFALCISVILSAAAGSAQAGQSSGADDEVARRQLESGRAFVRQGNYVEALKDFKAVAETHGASSVADNALLEIARYYLDTAGDTKEATAAVEAILKTYPTSDSAPEAYLMAGRLALARGHAAADLDAALANFERVIRLFPASDVVPRSLVLAAEAHWYAGRYETALGNLMRVALEYPDNPAAADAYLSSARVFLSLGDPVSALEHLQRVRDQYPESPAAATALSRISILHRLYVRPPRRPPFVLAADPVGPARMRDVKALAMTARGALYWANDDVAGVVLPADAPAFGAGGKPRNLVVDASGAVWVLEAAALRPLAGPAVPLVVTRGTGAQEPLKRADAAVQVSNGDWLVMDETERGIQRFSRTGAYVGPFALTKVSKLVMSSLDEITGLDRDEKAIVFYDVTGRVTSRVPLKGPGYELSNPVDFAFDALGHLYVLGRDAIAVFSPYAAPPASSGAAPSAPPAGRTAAPASPYRLLTIFSEPENSPTGLRRATAFALDTSGAVYVFDERAGRVLVYR